MKKTRWGMGLAAAVALVLSGEARAADRSDTPRQASSTSNSSATSPGDASDSGSTGATTDGTGSSASDDRGSSGMSSDEASSDTPSATGDGATKREKTHARHGSSKKSGAASSTDSDASATAK